MSNRKFSKEFIQHISQGMLGKSIGKVSEVLDKFNGKVFEGEGVKKDGWYPVVGEKVVYNGVDREFVGIIDSIKDDCCFVKVSDWVFIKAKVEHLSKYGLSDVNAAYVSALDEDNARPQPKERDYTGVRFRSKNGNGFCFTITKYFVCPTDYVVDGNYYSQQEVDMYFKDGTWIEVKEETPIKQVTVNTDFGEFVYNNIDALKDVEQTPSVHSEMPKETETEPLIHVEKPKDYEILMWHYDGKERHISSVKRLSDGEVFSIGDLVDECVTVSDKYKWIISEFSLKDTRCFSCGVNIDYLKKFAKESSPSIHSELPKIPTDIELLAARITKLEEQDDKYQKMLDKWDESLVGISELLKPSSPEQTKKNLDIDVDDWKKRYEAIAERRKLEIADNLAYANTSAMLNAELEKVLKENNDQRLEIVKLKSENDSLKEIVKLCK